MFSAIRHLHPVAENCVVLQQILRDRRMHRRNVKEFSVSWIFLYHRRGQDKTLTTLRNCCFVIAFIQLW